MFNKIFSLKHEQQATAKLQISATELGVFEAKYAQNSIEIKRLDQ